MSSGWEWRVFWRPDGRVKGAAVSISNQYRTTLTDWAVEAGDKLIDVMPAGTQRKLREERTDTYVNLNDPSVGLKLRDVESVVPLVELKLRKQVHGLGLEFWDKVVAEATSAQPQGTAVDQVVEHAVGRVYPEIFQKFKARRLPKYQIPVQKVRTQCVHRDDCVVKLEAAEMLVHLPHRKELFRSICVEGTDKVKVKAIAEDVQSCKIWQSDFSGNTNFTPLTMGYPEFLSHLDQESEQ